jgi:acetyl-CoA carboxylase biotin carboxyl carrier protein
MQLADVAQLIKLLDKSSLTEISFSDEKTKVVLKKESYRLLTAPTMPTASAQAPLMPSHAVPIGTAEKSASSVKSDPKLKDITSPMVGTFYACPSPGAEPFVQAGTAVKSGQVLCVIEAMKIMNEIESDVSGVVEEVCVPSETPVEYGTVLFRVRLA